MGRLREGYDDLCLIEGLAPERMLFLHLSSQGETLVWARVIYAEGIDRVGLVSQDVAHILAALLPDCATWLSKITYSKAKPLSDSQLESARNLTQAHKAAIHSRRARHEFAHQISQNLSY